MHSGISACHRFVFKDGEAQMSMKYKAVIFDLDGTLLDTLDDLTYAVNIVLESRTLPVHTADEIRTYVGDGAAKLIERAMPEGSSDDEVREATEEYKRIYAENMLRSSAPYPGIPEVLDSLREEGYLLAVVSNKYALSTEKLCCRFFPQINKAMGEMEERGIKRKPAPDMLLSVIDDFGIGRDEVIYVGDSEVDIMTARAAGVPCISVTWGFKDREFLISHGAEHVAENASELLQAVHEINS